MVNKSSIKGIATHLFSLCTDLNSIWYHQSSFLFPYTAYLCTLYCDLKCSTPKQVSRGAYWLSWWNVLFKKISIHLSGRSLNPPPFPLNPFGNSSFFYTFLQTVWLWDPPASPSLGWVWIFSGTAQIIE